MASKAELRTKISESLAAFGYEQLATAALNLLGALGYHSNRALADSHMDPAAFADIYGARSPSALEQALLQEWRSLDLLFQLTDDDVRNPEQLQMIFDSREQYDGSIIESYLFAAIELKNTSYTRQQLAAITRAVNRFFAMPVLILFRHGSTITLSIVRRRVHKLDENKDVLEKVTLIKDIHYGEPLRAHIDILHDLSLPVLYDEFFFHNFVGLHKAWEKRLDSYALTERFYREVANWYFWASSHRGVVFPRSVKGEEAQSLFLIRLLTRLIFCWFLQEKGLLPRELFRSRFAERILKDFSPGAGTYYQAVLQNLFFATLSQEVHLRDFRKAERYQGRSQDRGVNNLYRYESMLKDAAQLLQFLKQVPFVNGGLFECLDRVDSRPEVRSDDYSEEKQNHLCLPNELFFSDEYEVDLSKVYDDQRRRSEKVSGLFEIFSRYKFTVEENTPLEQDIALDPELLGHVFENLSAAYNEDTRTTARKATGSFYTPREIVSYMVDEALLACLRNHLTARATSSDMGNLDARLRLLFDAVDTNDNPFNYNETVALVDAIDHIKIIDPACGSGAFPMGALQRLVDLLQKLDSGNVLWRDVQRRRAVAETDQAYRIGDHAERKERLDEIEAVFTHNTTDYGRKLYLIENCLYGIDIQPIACQIAKLRFFIALIVDQKVDTGAENFGVRPLPNLETRIVAADTLIPVRLKDGGQLTLLDNQIRDLREQLEQVRHNYFTARKGNKKRKYREQDTALRQQIADLLRDNQLPSDEAARLAAWDPYNQNTHADFFDPAWMFGVPVGRMPLNDLASATLRGSLPLINESSGQMESPADQTVESGFDIVIGNPPYVRQEQIKGRKASLKLNYDTFSGTADLYVYFYERAVRLLKPGGVISFITSNKWYRSAYGAKLRAWLATNLRLLRLVDFGDAPVFTAIAYPTIVIGERVTPQVKLDNHIVQALTWHEGRKIEAFQKVSLDESFALPQHSLAADGWRLEGSVERKLLERIRSTGQSLERYCGGRFYYGIKTGLNEAFVVTKEQFNTLIAEHASSKELLKPYIRGRDIKRWRIEAPDLWLIFVPWHFPLHDNASISHASDEAERAFRAQYPALYEHLAQFRSALTKRDRTETGIRYEWYALQRYREYWREFLNPKVVMPAITDGVNFAPDYAGYFGNDKTNICIPPSIPFMLAIANSSISWWFSQQVFASKQGGFYEFKPMYVSQLPIPSATAQQQNLIERLVGYLTWLHNAHPFSASQQPLDVMIGYFEQLLNGLVYELFFPNDLYAQKLWLFKYSEEGKLPDLSTVPESKKLVELSEVFERIYDGSHPIRGSLFALRNLDLVQIIEGEK